MNNRRTLRRWVARAGIGSAIVLSLGATYAYHALSQRPGESALRFVPSDAIVTVSMDLSPSPSQALTFKHIDDALARNGLDGIFQKSVVDGLDHSKLAELIKPYALRAGAVALMPGPGAKIMDNPGVLAFLSVSDGKAVEEILSKNLYPQFYKGFRYYKFKDSSAAAAVIDNELAISPDFKVLYEAHLVASGSAPSIVNQPDFVEARSHVAGDANIMALVSPKLMESFQTTGPQTHPMKDWMACGLAIREDGIAIDVSGKSNLDENPELKAIANVPPLRSDLFSILPAGAYGVATTSGLSDYAEMIRKSLEKAGTKSADFEKGLDDQLGIDYEKDVLPAFKGDAVIAAYPGDSSSTSGIDFLVVVDDQNGGDPSNLATKVEQFIDGKIHQDNSAPKEALFQTSTHEGAKIYKLGDEFQRQMSDSLDQGMKDAPVHKNSLIGNKTFTWATVGHTVIVSTSQDLLARSVGAYQHQTNSLSSDSAIVKGADKVVAMSQSLASFSLARIAQGVEGTIVTSKMSASDQSTYHQVLSLFEGLKEPLHLNGITSPDGSSNGTFFIPMEYDKTIDLIGSQMKKEK